MVRLQILWTLVTVSFVLWMSPWPLVNACFPTKSWRRRTRQEPPLFYQESVPQLPEHSREASGKPQKPISVGDPRYNDLIDNYNDLIQFRDKFDNPINRKMSRRCNERLNTLAMLVVNQWPGVKLRVLKAWAPNDDHRFRIGAPVSVLLHFEGRAVDLGTSPLNKSKNGQLARMAVHAGFDWVHYEHRGHIHASVKSDILSRNTRSLRCFPAQATVQTDEGYVKPVAELKQGDSILSFDMKTQSPVFSPFITYLHVDSAAVVNFHEISTENHTKFIVSQEHLIFIVQNDCPTRHTHSYSRTALLRCGRMVPAGDVKIGDFLVISRNKSNFPKTGVILEKITKIQNIFSRGLYAPVTLEGTVVVDGVVASNYAGVKSHSVAHWALSPLRIFFKISRLFESLGGFLKISKKTLQKFVINQGNFSDDHGSKTYSKIHWYAEALWRLADLIETYSTSHFFIKIG